MVRCSSCSAPRTKGTLSCQHCGADYTLNEQDLHTICPSCMTRVSDRARFCHHCGVPVTPGGNTGNLTPHSCPCCGHRHKLNDRTLGEPPVTILECTRCAGLWLSRKVFEMLADRARDQTLSEQLLQVEAADPPADGRTTEGAAFYRRCPQCRKPMHRANFGRKSGILIDICKKHGLWFDVQELDAILRWVKRGGESRARTRQEQEIRHEERNKRFRVDPTAGVGMDGPSGRDLQIPAGILGDMLSALFDV